jgi:hypothetical protein
MKQENLSQMKTGEIAARARKAGVQNVEQMNKDQMIQAMSRSSSPSAKRGHGGGRHAASPRGTGPQDWKNIPGNQS